METAQVRRGRLAGLFLRLLGHRFFGAEIESGKADFHSLEKYMLEKGEADANQSGRQEMLENIVNQYI